MSLCTTSHIKTSSIGQYEGYSEALYDDSERTSFYFEADDGTRLAVDIHRPVKDGVVETEPLPVIFHYTPYGRIMPGPAAAAMYGLPADEPYFDDWGIEGLLDLTRFGYVVAIADVRGTGASFGWRLTTNSRREALDGKQIIEWLAEQPFCNGNVGIAGYSYTGQTTLSCISMRPKGLVASFTCMTDYNKFDGWFRGGIPRTFETHPDDTDFGDDEAKISAAVEKLAAETLPVDDDPDGVLLRQAVRDHMKNGDQVGIMRDLVFRDSQLEADGEHWKVISASTYADDINASGVAMYCVGGVYDAFRRDTIVIYENYTGPKKMILGPWYHMDQKFDVRWDVEMLRWFDRWLKGIENGVDTEAPVAYKLCEYNFDRDTWMGADTGSYVTAPNWPYAAGTRTTLFAGDEGALLPAAPEASTLSFTDPYGATDGVETKLTSNDRGNGIDQRGVCFTSAPLEADCDVIGHPMAHVAFSLDDPGWMTGDYDVDVYVSLVDYDPATGKGFQISSGQLRTSERATGECPYDFLGLPWHPSLEGENEWLELGRTYEVDIDLLPTAYRVKRGHCLRLTLANSYGRMYYHGLNEYTANPDCAKPTVSFKLGGDAATSITLPNIYAVQE